MVAFETAAVEEVEMAGDIPLAEQPANARYHCNMEELNKLRTEAPWMQNPKYFETVALSPSAVMKIMMHCQSGVEKGIAKGGNPIEVMGLLLGRPDPTTPHTLVVTDAFPLPIEGFETRVVADDETVVNHMIAQGESLETTRTQERFMGWYHSHPFDVSEHSHCFLSQTDLTTQLQWQRAEDPHGNPFCALVVDPLRSTFTQEPHIKAFRAYPPEYNSSVANECPDGTIEANESLRLEHWGSCWNRYYELGLEYYMSSTTRPLIVHGLTQDSLWMRSLVRAPPTVLSKSLYELSHEWTPATQAQTIHLGNSFKPTSISSSASTAGASGTAGGSGSSEGSRPGSSANKTFVNNARTPEWEKVQTKLNDVVLEQISQEMLQQTKATVFGGGNGSTARP